MGKKSLIALLIVLVLGAVAVYVIQSPVGLSVGGVDFGGQERAWLTQRTIDFLEDLQFKDFDKASTYHLGETQKARDVPGLIRRVFGIKHEVLDIKAYRITEVDLDRSKKRARVRAVVDYRVLGDRLVREDKSNNRDIEMLIYWFRGDDGKWAMELESSLR